MDVIHTPPGFSTVPCAVLYRQIKNVREEQLQKAIEAAKLNVLGSDLHLPDLCEPGYDISQTELRGMLLELTYC